MMKTMILLSASLWVLGAQARPPAGPSADCCSSPVPATGVTLTASETRALLFQIEEERMARELYTALDAKWDARTFSRIRAAEARHEQQLRALAERAGLTVPAAVEGRFADPVLQQRHDSLLARGLASRADAWAVGAAVERQDLADLEALLRAETSTALREVATRLAAGSTRHLAAFTDSPGAAPSAGQRGRRARI